MLARAHGGSVSRFAVIRVSDGALLSYGIDGDKVADFGCEVRVEHMQLEEIRNRIAAQGEAYMNSLPAELIAKRVERKHHDAAGRATGSRTRKHAIIACEITVEMARSWRERRAAGETVIGIAKSVDCCPALVSRVCRGVMLADAGGTITKGQRRKVAA